jgi:hypothetical protein
MMFEKKQDYILPRETNSFLPGTVATFDIPRELPIESMFLVATWQVSAYTSPTFLADGPLGHFRRIVLNGPDGARNRNVIDASGCGLIELSKHLTGFIDVGRTGAGQGTAGQVNSNRVAGTYSPTFAATTDYTLCIPMHFALPNLDDPVSSAFLLPVDRYNANPQLQISMGATTDVFSAGTFSNQTARLSLLINRRIVNRLNWPIVDGEIGELRIDYTATGANQRFDIPITGYYTSLLLRQYRTNAIRGPLDSATLADYDDADNNNAWTLELSGNNIRRFRLADLERENDLSEASGSGQGDILAGSYLMDFIQDRVGSDSGDAGIALGSCLNANIPLNSGSRLSLIQNIQTFTSGQTRTHLAYHKFYGNPAALQFT